MWIASKVGAGSIGAFTGLAGTPVVIGALIAGVLAQLIEPPSKVGSTQEGFVDGIVDGSAALFAQALTQGVMKQSAAAPMIRP